MIAILLNTIIIFLGGFWPDSMWVEWLDAMFTLTFLCEAVAKISKLGWSGYWKIGWDKFDFIVLIIALPSLVSPFLEHSLATNTILALRAMRLFKSFKSNKFS